ncbi:MAG: XRE family transcriptional regulator [Alphaproteobacteria bacterium]|nr:XRE family transcriptional regulator [Alphaproteobacteria bacterium]
MLNPRCALKGLRREAIRDILKGRSRNPRADTLEALGRILGCTIDALRGGNDAASTETLKVSVIGKVRAGEWVEALEWPQSDWYAIDSPIDERFNGVGRFALEVHGPSMNQVYAEGDVIICVRYSDIGREPRTKERVVVQRNNGQGMIEATVKEFVIDDDGAVWLWPRSSHPEFQQPYLLKEPPIRREVRESQMLSQSGSGFRETSADEFDIIALVIGSYRRE